jgi:tetratricopeptide (TPR) repeat protein
VLGCATMSAAFVLVRARVRFMVYGQRPADRDEVDVWILRVPEQWVQAVAPGTSSPELTRRCGTAVQAQYTAWRAAAVSAAMATLAATGEYDAGHYALEGASVWRALDEELRRRAWLGRRRFFRVLDDQGGMREATDADAPALQPLTGFEEHAFAAWRADETYTWVLAADEGEKALRAVTDDADAALVGEIGAIVVRAYGKMQRADDLDRAAREVGQVLESRGADAGARAMVHVRHGDGLLGLGRGREAADAYAAAADLFGPDDPRIAWLRLSQGLALLRSADFDGAREPLAAAVDMLERRPEAERPIDQHAPALHNLGLCLEHAGLLDEAEQRLRAALALREQAGHREQALDSRVQLARVLARCGRPHDARAHLDQMRPLVSPGTKLEGLVLWTEALIEHATGGDSASIAARLDRAAALLRGDPAWSSWIAEDRAALA